MPHALIRKSFRLAAAEARRVAVQHGTPVYVSRGGRVIALDPKTGKPLHRGRPADTVPRGDAAQTESRKDP